MRTEFVFLTSTGYTPESDQDREQRIAYLVQTLLKRQKKKRIGPIPRENEKFIGGSLGEILRKL